MTYKWTPEAITLVEDTSLSSRDVARRLGINPKMIQRYRKKHGIKPGYQWTPRAIALIGDTSLTSREVAKLLDIRPRRVQKYRRKHGIKRTGQGSPFEWTPEAIALATNTSLSPSEVARRLGISTSSISKYRREHDIIYTPGYQWTPEEISLAKDTSLTGREVARRLGIHERIVNQYRRGQNIKSVGTRYRWTPEAIALVEDTSLTLEEIARDLDISTYTISRYRIEHNIARPPAPQGIREQRMAELSYTLTLEQWLFACEWFDFRCAYCRQEALLVKEHLIPVARGGPYTALNIIPACWSCNSSKGTRQAHRWILGHFGTEAGQAIIDNIIEYLTEVSKTDEG